MCTSQPSYKKRLGLLSEKFWSVQKMPWFMYFDFPKPTFHFLAQRFNKGQKKTLQFWPQKIYMNMQFWVSPIPWTSEPWSFPPHQSSQDLVEIPILPVMRIGMGSMWCPIWIPRCPTLSSSLAQSHMWLYRCNVSALANGRRWMSWIFDGSWFQCFPLNMCIYIYIYLCA